MAFPSGWARKCAITIDQTLCGTADSTNFTVLLTRANMPDEICSPTDADRAQSDGGDLRFSSDSAGTTQLALHVESWEYDSVDAAADAEIELHVKVPTLDTTSDTVIYVWYDTAATDTQPAVTDTYGAENAYDTDHCHVWHLNEAPADTAPEYKDIVGGRDLFETDGTAAQVTGKVGNAFDGNGSARALRTSGLIAPDNTSSAPCTNTGLCYVTDDDTLLVANWDNSEIIEINKTTGAEISSFALTEGETKIQNIAFDSVDDEIIIANATDNTWAVYSRAGVFQTSYTASGQNVTYDSDSDTLWGTAAGPALQERNKSTGATIGSAVTLSGSWTGTAVIDGICYNSDDDTIYISNETDNQIHEVNKTTGATIRSFDGPRDIEQAAYDSTAGVLYVNGDAGLHASPTGENIVHKMSKTGGHADWRHCEDQYTLEFWCKPDSVSTAGMFGHWSANSSAESFYQEVQVRSGGALRIYENDTGFVSYSSAIVNGSWNYVVVRQDATTLGLYVDGSVVGTPATQSFVGRFDGQLSIGSRADGTFKHNGAIDDCRLSKTARSTSWITARYNNSDNPGTFASAGTPEVGVVGSSVINQLQGANLGADLFNGTMQ